MNRNIHRTNGAHTFLTIREAAKQPECPYGETKLRQMQKEGMLPGIWNGNRFLINFPLLLHRLELLSLQNTSDV